MAEITDEELAELRAAKAERDEIRAEREAAAVKGEETKIAERSTQPRRRAVLDNGETYEYTGAHPTRVHLEDGIVHTVVSVHEA